MSKDKSTRIRRVLSERNIDALLCKIPENVLFLSEYWPNTGDSAILYPLNSKPVLVVPKSDLPYVCDEWVEEIMDYKLVLDEDPNEKIAKITQQICRKKDLLNSTIGCEVGFETVAGSHIGGEVTIPGKPTLTLFEKVLPGATFVDASLLLRKLRMVKTSREIEAIKICNEIVAFGLEVARSNLGEGVSETELASLIESEIHSRGVGYKGVKRARGFVFVMSGSFSTANAWGPFNISTDRKFKKGDLVLIEIDACTDGYWSDISRTFVIGEADEKQREIMEIILSTEERVVKNIRLGMRASAVDKFARDLLKKDGYEEFFLHKIGHGVGFAFHEMPMLSSTSDSIIELGMSLAIEPGIYIPEWGGIRVEDNIVLLEEGRVEYLSEFIKGF